jgi:hypothetical protein
MGCTYIAEPGDCIRQGESVVYKRTDGCRQTNRRLSIGDLTAVCRRARVLGAVDIQKGQGLYTAGPRSCKEEGQSSVKRKVRRVFIEKLRGL